MMFNNAGIGGDMAPAPLGGIDLGNFDRIMAVNARGVLAGVKHAARVMVPRRAGSIICAASTAAVLGSVAPPAYSASKAAVLGLVRAVVAELARSGVRVNAVSPHGIPMPLATAAAAQWFPDKSVEERRRIVERDMNEMVGPVLETEDIARAALYLASDETNYVNGQNLVIDGGYTMSKAPRPAPAARR
jgi:NAD(P)-dependent dehydrogenase (short-subunit alcohol dehydrogenase family)